RAHEILTLDDIFELIGDESTPRPLSREIIRLLENHPDKVVQTHAQELRLRETERLNKKMKEIEVSVNAYFDVIFQSLNYARINTNKDAVSSLKTAIQYLQQFVSEAPDQDESGGASVSQDFLRKAISYFESSINELYGDTKKEVFSELDQIQGMIQHILDLKNFKFDEENPREEDIDPEVLEKAVMIWRVAISQFLGRVKDLEEMLRLKWGKLMKEKDKSRKVEEIESDLYEAFEEIEFHHKESVECKLKIPCRDCKRRGCAAERFMLQTDFLLDELSRNFGKTTSLTS
ncbi:MAG: hypothetical protein KDC45_07905, partial [Bacteroidetes bacterium]|nr:hypothetical protein [Bacteroidota bacterium]